MGARHYTKGCPKCGGGMATLDQYDDGSLYCNHCNTVWDTGAAFDADHIARTLVKKDSSGTQDWIENGLKDQLNELVKKSKLDVYEEIKGIAERTMEGEHHPDTGRMLLGILKWSEEQIHKNQPKREEEF